MTYFLTCNIKDFWGFDIRKWNRMLCCQHCIRRLCLLGRLWDENRPSSLQKSYQKYQGRFIVIFWTYLDILRKFSLFYTNLLAWIWALIPYKSIHCPYTHFSRKYRWWGWKIKMKCLKKRQKIYKTLSYFKEKSSFVPKICEKQAFFRLRPSSLNFS